MVPRPSLTLTIPSINDDTVLDCRIYTPPNLLAKLKSESREWRKKSAIVAHPYAPLGGCQDDPIVDVVVSCLLEDDFFVGTFNFRYSSTSVALLSYALLKLYLNKMGADNENAEAQARQKVAHHGQRNPRLTIIPRLLDS